MKILGKLLLGFISVALLCAVVGVVAVMQVGTLNENIRSLAEETIPTLAHLKMIDQELTNLKVAMRNLANPYVRGDEAFYKRQIANIEKARNSYKESREAYEKLPADEEEKQLYLEVKALYDPAAAYNDEIISLAAKAQNADPELAAALYDQIYTLISGDSRLVFDNLQAALRKVVAFDQQLYGVERPRAALKAANTAIMVLIAITVVAFLVALILGLFLGRAISGSLRNAVGVLNKIASGDTSERLVVKSNDEFKQVAGALNTVATTIEALVAEAAMLTKAAVEGKLATRGDASKFKGGYHAIVQGVNETLDSVIGPLTVSATYVDRISKGDIPPKITDNYNGDFNLIKNNLNTCIDAVNALVADSLMLAQAAVEGRLTTRADASLHSGDYKKIVEGVNKTLDLVVDPVNETIAILKKMSDGDMTPTMTGHYSGDFDVLKTALNSTLDAINEILGQVSVAVEQVSSGSQQVSQASQSLSQGATEQASSLEEITSSVTEIAGQTRQNTENAVQVNTLAKGAKDNAERGDSQMKDLVLAMSDINSSAEEIRKIVKAIDDISFQINLLALNANVEAARAGKYGKGFAVVAEEVRNLAVRSAASVKETTGMVDEAIANIGKGNALVEVTAKQLSEIVTGSAQVAGLAEEVSTASREQSQGLEQITSGLTQIDQVTQSNTASAEESASAAEELSSQAQQLKAMIGRFRLKQREEKMTEERMLAMLRAEMAAGGRQVHTKPRALALRQEEGSPAKKNPAQRLVNPADVISLDDDDFGKLREPSHGSKNQGRTVR
ncbi:methyl-accepting chemotaxis protein [Treponema sp.]